MINSEIMEILLSILFGYVLAHVYEKLAIVVSRNTPLVLFRYRLHHSLYGIMCFLLAFWFQQYILYGIGIGIIIQHTITDGFRFVSKER